MPTLGTLCAHILAAAKGEGQQLPLDRAGREREARQNMGCCGEERKNEINFCPCTLKVQGLRASFGDGFVTRRVRGVQSIAW